MVAVKRRKKSSRQHGATTHGWGAMKKHRGGGHRGGRGNAGSGKRGDAKKPSYWGDQRYYGKRGFSSKVRNDRTPINVGHLSSIATRLVNEGKAHAKGGVIAIDLAALGYDRLLGGGIVREKLAVTVATSVPRAIEKIEAAGGSVTVTEKKAE